MQDNERFGEVRSAFAQRPRDEEEASRQWELYCEHCLGDRAPTHISQYILDCLFHSEKTSLFHRETPLSGWAHELGIRLGYAEGRFDACVPIPGHLPRQKHAHAVCLAERFLQAVAVAACHLTWRQKSRVRAYPPYFFFRVLLPGWEFGFGREMLEVLPAQPPRRSYRGVDWPRGRPVLQADQYYSQFLSRASLASQRAQLNLNLDPLGELFQRLCADLGMLLYLVGINPTRIEKLYGDLIYLAQEVAFRYADPGSLFKTFYYPHEEVEQTQELNAPAHREPQPRILPEYEPNLRMWEYAVNPFEVQKIFDETLEDFGSSELWGKMLI